MIPINPTGKTKTEPKKSWKLIVGLIFLALLLFLWPLALAADEVAVEPAISGSFTFSVQSEYVGSNGAIFHDSTVFQSDLFLSFGGGWYVDIWSSFSPNNTFMDEGGVADYGDEADLFAGKAGTFGSFGYDVGAGYLWVAGDDDGFRDVVETYVTFSREVGAFSPYIKVEHYFPVRGSEPAAGQLIRAGSTFGTELSSRATLSTGAEVFYDTGAFGFDDGFLTDASASVSFQVGQFTVTPKAKYYLPLETMSSREGTLDYGISLSISF